MLSYEGFVIKCISPIQCGDETLRKISESMLFKLESNESIVCCYMAQLARIFDPRIASDVVNHESFLTNYVPLSIGAASDPSSRGATGDDLFQSEEESLFEQLISAADNTHCGPDGEISRFLFSTAVGDRRIDPLKWWCTPESRFPSIATGRKDVLALQASSVVRESAFSVSRKLVSSVRSSLSDESIVSCMLVRAWNSTVLKKQ